MQDIRIKAGLIFHVDIDFVGEPTPEVTWTVDRRDLETTDRTTVTSIGYHTIVHTVNAKRSDSGLYHLMLKNSSGVDEGSFQVIVLDRPGPPEAPLEYEEITSQSVTLSWKPPKDNGGSEITLVQLILNIIKISIKSIQNLTAKYSRKMGNNRGKV